MLKKSLLFLGIVALVFSASSVLAEDTNLVEIVKTGCEKELASYCKDITPGQGRVLACLYANGDKLSGKCEYALYDAAARLERVVAALTFVANECDQDLDKFCANIAPGQGRLLECLKKNRSSLEKRCGEALDTVGVK